MTGAPEHANRGQTVELIISKSRIQAQKARMILRQFHCESLAAEFKTDGLNQKAGLAFPWDDLLERRERKGVAAR